ncbi:MAG: toxin of toxin-antitoxin system [Desulfobacteraceae bacterium 4572_35.1]|nr:MAG: toxin of toxin-antitoxin system [Desulfobacteraceae bacterium 4572_35.1]
MSWNIVLSRAAVKDVKKIKSAGLSSQVKKLLATLKEDPFSDYPTYEKLVGNLRGYYSRRINIQHRLVYQVIEDIKTVKILRMWSHYGS